MRNTSSLTGNQQNKSQLKVGDIKKTTESGKHNIPPNNISDVSVNITNKSTDWIWEGEVNGYKYFQRMVIEMVPKLKKNNLKKNISKGDQVNSSVGSKAIKQKRKSVSSVSTSTTFSSLDFAFVDFYHVSVEHENELVSFEEELIIITLRRQ